MLVKEMLLMGAMFQTFRVGIWDLGNCDADSKSLVILFSLSETSSN